MSRESIKNMMLGKSCLTNRSVLNTSQKLAYAKKEIFIGIILIFFYIFAQNIDCGYKLEPHW